MICDELSKKGNQYDTIFKIIPKISDSGTKMAALWFLYAHDSSSAETKYMEKIQNTVRPTINKNKANLLEILFWINDHLILNHGNDMMDTIKKMPLEANLTHMTIIHIFRTLFCMEGLERGRAIMNSHLADERLLENISNSCKVTSESLNTHRKELKVTLEKLPEDFKNYILEIW